ncbi:MAG TPA: hypothetical protein VGM50_09480, partial [Gemmatimonadaceae bacterium]
AAGSLSHDIPQSVCTADEDRDIARSLSQLLQPCCELLRGHCTAIYIACKNLRTRGKRREQPFTFPLAHEVRASARTCGLFADLVKV